MTAPPLNVLLVDDHAVVRAGYRVLLEKEASIRVVGEAESVAQALERLDALQPDVAIVDVTLKDGGGIDLARRMRSEHATVRVIMFSMHDEAIFASRSLEAGASGYVTKSSGPNELVHAVHEVAAGRRFLSHDVAQRLALHSIDPDATGPALAERELEVLRLLANGVGVKEMAHVLGLSPKTVANVQSSLRRKLGATTSVRLADVARKLGLLPRE